MKTTPLLCIISVVCLLFGGCKKQPSSQKVRPSGAILVLCRAAREGNLEQVRYSIKRGFDINGRDDKGFTPLHHAADKRCIDIIKFLVSKGADVNARNNCGNTPLSLLVSGSRNMFFKPLIANDTADYLKRGDYYYLQNELNRAIEDYTFAIQLKPDDSTPYFERGQAWAEKGIAEQAVKDWIQAIYLNWNYILEIYYTRRLLKSPDEELDNLIKEAAKKHLFDLKEVTGSAVYYPAIPGDFYTISLILSDPFEEEKFLDMLQNDNPVVRAMGLICLARENLPLYEKNIRSFYTDTAVVRYDPRGCVVTGITLGQLAKRLIEDPNMISYWSSERTSKRFNVYNELNGKKEEQEVIEVIKLLIEKGAKANTQNDFGETPLLIATYWGHQNIVKLLIENGADVNIMDKDGITPLKEAIKFSYQGLSDLLRKHGATE
jgi:ankyrin repeat protein